MAWLTFKNFVLLLLLELITTHSIASQDNNSNRPHSEVYKKNRVNQYSSNSNAQFSLNNNATNQNINPRHFPIGYSANFVPGYNPYPYQQTQFGYPGIGIPPPPYTGFVHPNFGTTLPGYPGANHGIGYPSTSLMTPYAGGGTGIGSPGYINGKGIMYPLPFEHYPLQNFQQTFKPQHHQTTVPFSLPNGFGGFYPSFSGVPNGHAHLQVPHQQGIGFYSGSNDNQSPHYGFDVGSLPRMVKVPGELRMTPFGKDILMECTFPRYLLLVQGIYWHHKYDAFGSYYDTTNGFGPEITVETVNMWKSTLKIQGYEPERHNGVYRCLSAAALPTDDNPIQIQPGFSVRNGDPISSTTEPYQYSRPESSQEFDSGETRRQERTKKRKNSRKMKFPPTRKIRFSRQVDTDNSLEQDHNRQDDQQSSATDPSTFYPNSNEPYDPFVSTRNYDSPSHLRNPFLDFNTGSYNQQNAVNNNFRYSSTPNQNPFLPNQQQTNRHHLGNYPGFGFPTTEFPHSHTPGYGLQTPYFKPSYSIYTVFVEGILKEQMSKSLSNVPYQSTSPHPGKN